MSQQAPAPSPVSKEALSALRHTIRAPLHQLISYAELITEEVPSGDVNHILSGIIARCESVLKIISNDPATENAERVVTALHDQLVDSGDEILRLAEQLQSMGERPPFFAERNDFSKLHLAAVSFRKIVQSLESEGSLLPPPVIPEGGGVSLALGGDRNARSNSSAAKRRMMHGSILIVDDNEGNRDVLSRRLLRDGCDVMLAEGVRQALRMAECYDFDIVLLDIMMPEMDGYTVLSKIKEHPKLRQLPVIMITAVDEIESVVRCIELGADDYLLKPFNPTLLRARINALLDRRRLREEEARHASELESALARVTAEQTKAKELLLNILPLSIAQELQENGVVEPMYFEDVTVAFADFVGFTLSTVELPAEDLVNVLHGYFTAFDRIMVRYMLEKLKTIGDCYMWAGGLPVRSPSHPVDMILAAFE